ncbi:MAG: tetratricopeptide repeat protein [Bacteroidales bacterium]|nr:tetratricopeptide repeat protein [Bacteroidales bacterium]
MSSIIEGYNYDIFISYRQKDNKGDRWVSEFVESLKTELESTFKEEISVYFDINPHDGLLETHDVDESLKEKLKCLIFIPIISRTYCDPKSFAWEHEFKAFVEMASNDQFGLKVKLLNGNVASRILPVRIHHLDVADIKECESVLGGVLRGVEFIYKEAGIDKPLVPDDDEKRNLNNTKYRIQIIKVAHAIKEIMDGMKAEPANVVQVKNQSEASFKEIIKHRKIDLDPQNKAVRWKLFSAVIIVPILIIASVFIYPKIFKRNSLERLRSSEERISIVVLPFQNMTNDTIWDVWQDGIQNELITTLSSSEELNVRLAESIAGLIQSKGYSDYSSITPSIAAGLSKKLNSVIFIYGTIKQAGPKIRLNAQLFDSKTEEVLKSFQIEGLTKEGNIFPVIDSLSYLLKDFLILSKLIKESPAGIQIYAHTASPEAYRCFIYGNNAVMKGDNIAAIEMYSQAVAIDSNFIAATLFLSLRNYYQGMYSEAKRWCLKVYNKRNQLPKQYQIMSNHVYALLFETPQEVIKYLKEYKEFDDQVPAVYYLLGIEYSNLNQYDKAIPEFIKSMEIQKKWDSKPGWGDYASLGEAYHKTGQFKKERNLYKKAEKDYPDNPAITRRWSILALTEGDTIAANRYLKKFISNGKNNSWTQAAIENNLASLYYEAGLLDEAEEYYRKVLSSAPERPARMNNLAWFLIDNDRNINEGLDLIDDALKLEPDNYTYLDTKGWGLFKQGKYQEAMELLGKSWSLKPVYDHEVYLHLEEVKKAVANQQHD